MLALQGAGDELGTLAHVEAIEKPAGADPEALVLAACGHSSQVRQRERTLAAMVAFLRREGIVASGETCAGAEA